MTEIQSHSLVFPTPILQNSDKTKSKPSSKATTKAAIILLF